MLKSKLACSIAVTAALLTACFGLVNDIRLASIAYRTLISIAIFGIFGYLIGIFIENHFEKLASRIKTKGQTIDIIAEEEEVPDAASLSFSPLTPDNFEIISSEK